MNRSFIIQTICLCTALNCAAAPVRVIRIVETREPADHPLILLHGETVQLRVRLLNYAQPLDLTGCEVTLHGRTNAQSAAESYQRPGAPGIPDDSSAAAAGWMYVDIPVSSWWPAAATQGRWTLAATDPVTTSRVLRAGGPLTIRGTAASDAYAPPPATLADTLRLQWLDDIALASNVLAAAVQGEAVARAAGDAVALTNWQASVNALTNAAALGETALQPFWAPTGHVATAGYADAATRAATADWATEATHAVDAGRADDLMAGGTADQRIAADIAGATNALVQTYLLGTNAWMSISNQTLTIWRETNGVPAALWSSAESEGGGGIDPTFANAVWDALAGKADAAWGKYAPDGSSNPDPAYMTYLNAPATMHASGYQWSTYGAYSVMAESGAVAYESGDDGTARWGLDLHTNYVGFVRGGSVIVAAKAGAITVTDGGTTNGIAEIDYPYTSGDFPALWFAPALDVPFSVQTGVVWIDNEDGTATVTAPATTPKGFWYASTTTQIDVIFDVRPPARLTGGVIGATNDLPVVYDSTITISSGGKNYRIPAQEVP